MPFKRATILANPHARRARHFDPESALKYLREQGYEARYEAPAGVEALTKSAKQVAEREEEILFVFGGDGTLRLVAGAIVGSKTALAALAGGTTNVWVRETNIPFDGNKAIQKHLDGQQVKIDLGRVNGEPFMLMVGIGWDAEIASHVSAGLKRRLGVAAYVLYGIPLVPSLRTSQIEWSTAEENFSEQTAILIVSNTRSYGGVVSFTPKANAADGLFDICTLNPRGLKDVVSLSVALLRSKLPKDERVVRGSASRIQIHSAGHWIQVDGDVIGQTPATIEIERSALLVSVPGGELPDIVRKEVS